MEYESGTNGGGTSGTVERADSLKLTPPVKGREHLFGWYPPGYNTFTVPSYKILATFEDEIAFKNNIQATIPSTTSIVTCNVGEVLSKSSEEVATSTSHADIGVPASLPGAANLQPTKQNMTFTPPTAAAPVIKAGRAGSASSGGDQGPGQPKPRQGLHARFEAIRRDLMRRQKDTPLVRMTSASPKMEYMSERAISRAMQQQAAVQSAKPMNDGQPVYSVISTGLQHHIPEPDLRYTRSPIQSRPSSSSDQSSASLRRSVSLPSTATGAEHRIPNASTSPPPPHPPAPEPPISVTTGSITGMCPQAGHTVTWGEKVRMRPSSAQVHKLNQPPIQCYQTESTNCKARSMRPKTAPAQLRKTPTAYTSASGNLVVESTGGVGLCLQGHRVQSTVRPTRPGTGGAMPRSWGCAWGNARGAPPRSFCCPPATIVVPAATCLQQGTIPTVDAAVPVETSVAVAEAEAIDDSEEPINERQVIQTLLEDDYDRALNKYGWRMEVHADPLHLKRGLISKRQSVSVKIPEPEILPQPPPMRKENRETFFHTSLPRKVLSFEIAPDFMSERYNAVREQMRKSGNWNYMDKNFSFVY